ncbi:hypothetical protein HMPREF0063_11956 [Aeromicrobium marinum DSM 15272]|uniref:CobQ/CobB/MinD/ParA nucleotide binding domain-containing protein n=1 Tax=Aeromicrobium marinum DSM 15272 TaxID=585531 RepID=E2SE20_9ACTN|nr:hypothetical protein [Aeromicrobium marinum]EFQ82747.1 hypothetical protein HMPREF0063_11956 [Aeromicrobium marinum DSM 15272]
MSDDVSGLMAACRSANHGRVDEIDDHLLEVEPDLRLLTGLPRGDMWSHVRTGALEIVLQRLRATHEVVVADTGACLEAGDAGPARSRNQAALHLVGEADELVVVGRADPVGLARLVRGLAELAEVAGRLTPTVVVNQMRPSLGWSESEVRDTLDRLAGVEPVAFLPWDQTGLDAAAMRGTTPRSAAPGSPFVARIETVVSALLTERAVIPSPRPV